MKVRSALLGFGAITFFYVIALVWVDSTNQVFKELPKLLSVLPILVILSLLSYIVRYARWHWLLVRSGHKTKVISGFLAYLAGFAFTATPGKVGELVRIRYLGPQGIPAWKVLAAFIYERAFDLISVLMLSALVISRSDIFIFAVGFVGVFLITVVAIALHPSWLTKISAYLRFYRLRKLAHLTKVLRDGLSGCRMWVTPLDVVISLVLGLLAWGITSSSFVWLLKQFNISIASVSALAIYPLSMLAGAASLLPGGFGTTEGAIVMLLSLFDVPFALATLMAVGIRVTSMWFAVLCGLIALGTLELMQHERNIQTI